MSALIDLIGKRFGLLVVVSRVESVAGRAAWVCKCDCGGEVTAVGQHLRRGSVTTCGCGVSVRAKAMGEANKRHGKTNSAEFRVWTGMISRCTNPADYRFKRYGGRGIKVCDRWLESFENFFADMGGVPFVGAELDRIDNDQGYEPNNCRWATSKQNNNNRSSNRLVEFGGKTQTVTQWAEEVGINPATLRVRLEAGWSIDRAINQPVRGFKNV